MSRAASRWIGPRLSDATRRRRTEWPPKRFAARLGLAMVLAILACQVSSSTLVVGDALTATLTVLSGLESLFGFCVGCRLYQILARFDLVQGCANGNCEIVQQTR